MSLESALGGVLKPLVGNRASPVIFGQPDRLPDWPAIRYTIIDSIPVQDRCGNGDEDHSVHRVQIDCADKTFGGARALRLAVETAMLSLGVEARLDFSGPSQYDEETKTYSEQLDYLIYGSP